tara:strand:+ start:313 stop:1062 length:750 start_codon:yes stop_codon:yes gene_type:complete
MGKLYDLQKVKSEKEREKRWEEFDDEAFLENIYEKCRIEPKPGREILNLNVPEEWLDWPLHIENSLKLYDSPTFCNAPGVGGVTDACYEIWEAANSDILIKKLFNPKNDYFFGPFPIYRIHTVGVIPPYLWNVSWPLLRRGSDLDITRRGKIQGEKFEFPEGYPRLEMVTDNTLFEIHVEPITRVGTKTHLILEAGGRSKTEAVSNWFLLAKQFRKHYRENFRKKISEGDQRNESPKKLIERNTEWAGF